MSNYQSNIEGQADLGAIDITLNSRYFEGQYQVRRNKQNEIVDPIMVHQQYILDEAGEPLERLQKLCPKVFLGHRNDYVEQNQQYPLHFYRGAVDEQKAYQNDRRVLPRDGLLHFYSTKQKSTLMVGQERLKGEKVQFLVSVTCYNESFEEVRNTLVGIHKNLIVFKRDLGIDELQIVVIVFQDGIMKVHDTPPFPQGQGTKESDELFKKRIEEDKQIEVIGRQPVHDNDDGDLEDQNYEDLMHSQQDETSASTMREWFYNTLDVSLFLRGAAHPLHERQQVIYHEAKYFLLNALKMPGNFPPSLPQNVAVLYQTRLSYDQYQLPQDSISELLPEEQGLKMTTFFLLKHTSSGKLSSQMWLFQGFCPQFKPKYIAMVDVGTIPDRFGLVNYFRAMEYDVKIGGISGYLQLYRQKEGVACRKQIFRERYTNKQNDTANQQQNSGFGLRRIFQALRWFLSTLRWGIWEFFFRFHMQWDAHHAQCYEITQACVLDKNFESLFGYLQVLPGAWCAYRREALFHSKQFTENLLEKKYLKMVLNPARKVRSVQEANMYLAEDRILCLGIVAQNGRDYKLIHAPDAIAETDSVPNFIQLLRQRRRWINSTWFALEYVLRSHSYYLEQSSHTFLTKFLAFPFVMLITRINRINQYLLVSFYYVVLHILTFDLLVIFQSTIPNTFLYNTLLGIVPATYFAIVFYIYLSCLTLDVSKPKGPLGRKNQKSLYAASSLVGLFQFVILMMVTINLYNKFTSRDAVSTLDYEIRYYIMIILLFINLLSIPFLMLLHVLVWPKRYKLRLMRDSFVYFLTYFYYQASYNHVLVIFSFCHIDDISWGTKGKQEEGTRLSYRQTKNSFISKWFFVNLILGFALVTLNSIIGQSIVLYAIILYASSTILIRFIAALIYFIKFYSTQVCRKRLTPQNQELYKLNREKILNEYQKIK